MTTESTNIDKDRENHYADFLSESTPILSLMNQSLLNVVEQIEQSDDPRLNQVEEESVSDLFRFVHSLTGLSGMAGLSNINCLAINLEVLLKTVRSEELPFLGKIVDVTHESVHALSSMNDQLQSGSSESIDYGTILSKMQDALEHAEAISQDENQDESASLETNNDQDKPEDSGSVNGLFQEQYVDLIAPIQDDAEIPEKYLSIFIDEADSTIDEIADTLLTHDDESDNSINNHLLICAHRIKGSAAAVGFHRPAKLAHFMEDILQELNDKSNGSKAM